MKFPPLFPGAPIAADSGDSLLGELVGYLQDNRPSLQAEWVRRVTHVLLLSPLDRPDIAGLAAALFDGYIGALAQDGLTGLQEFLSGLPEFLRPLGVGGREAPALASLLRDVCGRSLFRQFRHYEGRSAESRRPVATSRPRWPGMAPTFQPI